MDALTFNYSQILSTSMVLFAIIDILGAIPVVIELRKKAGHIESEKAAIVATVLMIIFLFAGETLLKVIGLDVESFAIAGSFASVMPGARSYAAIRRVARGFGTSRAFKCLGDG